jgi:hypothetical protein
VSALTPELSTKRRSGIHFKAPFGLPVAADEVHSDEESYPRDGHEGDEAPDPVHGEPAEETEDKADQ